MSEADSIFDEVHQIGAKTQNNEFVLKRHSNQANEMK